MSAATGLEADPDAAGWRKVHLPCMVSSVGCEAYTPASSKAHVETTFPFVLASHTAMSPEWRLAYPPDLATTHTSSGSTPRLPIAALHITNYGGSTRPRKVQ
ncbi:hypothetical protein PG996_012225 [Apiospora saccharicola]|uniref:Uncharacterized protein n=1 Tax=Apiospora saccharicola TaxID=335842 RepID=A0ABR1U4R7_9PEZI